MKWIELWAIAGSSATLLTSLAPLPVAAQSIVPAADGTGTQVIVDGPEHTITGGATSADAQNLFHRFAEFNLLTGESATFLTDPAVLNIFSGVTGANPSIIDGLLQVSGSNANLFLLNPNGILFGPNSALNLQGSFAAISADQVNFATGAFGSVGSPDYTALVGEPQSFSFSLANPGSVMNAGTLHVPSGESVVLVGGQVLNTGAIAAPGGEVIISAVEGGNLVRIAQADTLLNLEIATLAESGPAPTAFSPLSLPELLTGSETGQATNVNINADGTVQLASGAPVNTDPGSTTVAGTVDVATSEAGQILVLGNDILLTDTLLDASGALGGGIVRIGGDYQGQGPLPTAQTTVMDGDSIILADALDSGDGGRVILWAEGETRFQGFISAQAGPNGGDGGFIETSGRQSIDVSGGQAIASAPAGTAGTWLLDPSNINIDEDLALTIELALAGGTNFVASTIEGEAADFNGTLPGDGDIFLNADINATATNDATLTLTASRYIEVGPFYEGFAAPINITDGNLVLNLNQESLADIANPTITDALNTIGTVTGDVTVNLGAGTYQEGEQIFLAPGIKLQGAGADVTLLDGAGEYSVLLVTAASGNEASPSQVNDLTIANGNAGEGGGGGILNFGNLIINNSVIRNNEAATTGGGILNERFETSLSPEEGSLEINNSVIRENTAGTNGGGISNAGGNLTINTSTVASNTSGANGGGIDHLGGQLIINRSTITDNTSGADGGGLYASDGFNEAVSLPVDIADSTFFENTATNSGGAIWHDTTLIVRNSTIVANAADTVGGTTSTGGGIFVRPEGNSTTLISNIISGNTDSGSITDNRANVSLIAPATSGGTFTFTNNIFGSAGNDGIDDPIDLSGNLVPTATLEQIVGITLLDNGGPTQTLALVEGSPAIDAGSGSGLDQRGFPATGAARDIGAFEFQDSGSVGSGDPGDSSDGEIGTTVDICETSSAPPDCLEDSANPQPIETALPEARSTRGSGDGSVAVFEDYLGVEAAPFEDLDSLERARNITGVTPALVYASFVPPTDEAEVAAVDVEVAADARATTKGLADGDSLAQQIVAQAEGQSPTDAIADEDILQLVLVTANNEPRRINTGATRSEVLAAVRQLQVELTDRTRRRLDNYLVPAQALYGWLMTPLEATLAAENIGHVSFVLDQGLRSLPLAALHDGDQFIIENYSVGLMPSLSLTDTRIGNIRNAEVLAMGASEFSDQPPLPAVPLEISTIGRSWSGEAYLNETFTPETLVTQRTEDAYPILHLATHGQFTGGGLSNSYIQFWNRRLSLDELPQLQLSDPAVELLVLSACRTVLGDEEAELGFAGLAIKSGAKSAIAALWQVSDLETAGLMAELYTQLGQVTYKAEALRQAQLAMLRGEVVVQDDNLVWSGGSEPLPEAFRNLNIADTRHPYYWSAFTLVGNPW